MYKINEVTEKTGITKYTLRYYEKEGIIPPIARDKNGIRIYSDENLYWLEIVICLKETGMKNDLIKEIVSLSIAGEYTIEIRKKILENHKIEVIKQINILKKALNKIDNKIAYYNGELDNCK